VHQVQRRVDGQGVVRESVLNRVALLRGINVGKAKRLAMSDLKAVAEGLGWRNVSTLLATGNLLFTAPGTNAGPQLAAALEHALVRHHRLTTRIVVLSSHEVDAVLEDMPFGAMADNPSRLMAAAYVDAHVRATLEPLLSQDWAPGALALGRHAAYFWCPDGILASAVATAVARAARDGITSRNWSTWQKIQRLAAATNTPAAGHRSRITFNTA